MSELKVMEAERVAEDYFEVLGLLPNAPHDLVIEAYWHSAHRLQGAASTDPSAQAMLVRLNRAYAWLTGPGDDQRATLQQRPALENGQVAAQAERRGWLARLLKRAPQPEQASANHWELLHILPSTSPELVKLAYDFWRRQLRGSLGYGADPALARLTEAYQAIVAAASASPDQAGQAGAGSEISDSPNEVQQQAAAVQQQAAEVQQQAADVRQQAANETEPPALEDSLISVDIDSEAVDGLKEGPARSRWASRVWSAIASTAGSANRRTRRLLNAWWKRVMARAADPFHEYDRQIPLVLELQIPPEPGAVGADLTNMGDERLRSLAIEVGTERARIDENRFRAHSTHPSDTVAGDTYRPSEGVAEHDQASPAARLVAENGMSWAIGAQALSIGSDSTCDITAGAGSVDAEHVTARVWARGERVVLHALAPEPPVLVNGQRATWALLEDGDTLQVDGMMLRFEIYITGEGRAADVTDA